jgi:hypothetical protein
MAAELTRLTHKIAIQLHLVPEICNICSSRSRRPVRKLLDTPSYMNAFCIWYWGVRTKCSFGLCHILHENGHSSLRCVNVITKSVRYVNIKTYGTWRNARQVLLLTGWGLPNSNCTSNERDGSESWGMLSVKNACAVNLMLAETNSSFVPGSSRSSELVCGRQLGAALWAGTQLVSGGFV